MFGETSSFSIFLDVVVDPCQSGMWISFVLVQTHLSKT